MSRKVVFITGAGSGMGQLAARRALAAGDAVAALDVNQPGLEALGNTPSLLKLVTDITDPAAVQEAVRRTEAELGPIDRVINAAAIMPLGLLMEQKTELIHRIMAINYGGLVNVTHAVLPGMLARRRGEFISFSSSAGHMPILYMGAYDASKSAVNAFTEVLYHEYRDSGVQFCCVCPPPVATPLLKQAKDTVWPKMFDQSAALSPEQVLDDMEQGLAKGKFWIFPGPVIGLYVLLRRLIPGLLWKRVHQIEGR